MADSSDTLLIMTRGFSTPLSISKLPTDSQLHIFIPIDGSIFNRIDQWINENTIHCPGSDIFLDSSFGHRIIVEKGIFGSTTNTTSYGEFKFMLNKGCSKIGIKLFPPSIIKRLLKMGKKEIFSGFGSSGEWEILIIREYLSSFEDNRRNFELYIMKISHSRDTFLDRTLCRFNASVLNLFIKGNYAIIKK